jgi:major membrane immunogen (membrane-anchored lipoprotein)
MKVDIERDKNKKWKNCNLLNLTIKEQTKITLALNDYYYKIKSLNTEDADLVKEMLAKLDLYV